MNKKESSQNNTKLKSNNRLGKKRKRTSFTTYTGHALTPNEAKFIDAYLTTGNGRQAVIDAGYKSKAPQAYAQQLLNKQYITEEINHRMELAKQASIADATEIMQYLTSVMRGEVADQFGLEASLSERTKAAQELAKRQIDIPNRINGKTEVPEIKISLDWGE